MAPNRLPAGHRSTTMYTIRVRYPADARTDVETVRNTLLVSQAGKTGTLGSLATLTALPGQTEIRRENLQRDVAVTARLALLITGKTFNISSFMGLIMVIGIVAKNGLLLLHRSEARRVGKE